MIDASHANSSKQHERQTAVVDDIARQIERGERRIVGVMIESHLVGGRQDLVPGRSLTYGQSITDACLGWEPSQRSPRAARARGARAASGLKRSTFRGQDQTLPRSGLGVAILPRMLRKAAVAIALMLAGCAGAPVAPEHPPRAEPAVAAARSERPLIAFVLGAGAARGFAHAGALKVLDDAGIRADIVIGTSAGSLVGALYAGGIRGQALVDMALAVQRNQLLDFVLPHRGFIDGSRIQSYVNQSLHSRLIEQLDVPFVAVATDLKTGALVAFNRGDTGMAVRASCSVPAVFQPTSIEGREYVDGSLVSPLPVRLARSLGADIVIAINVGLHADRAPSTASAASSPRRSWSWRPRSRARRRKSPTSCCSPTSPACGSRISRRAGARPRAACRGIRNRPRSRAASTSMAALVSPVPAAARALARRRHRDRDQRWAARRPERRRQREGHRHPGVRGHGGFDRAREET